MARADWGDVRAAMSHVKVKVLPGREPVEMTRDAVLHLFRLLQRYNWCLESLESYQTRWATFWPRISAVERLLLVLLVSTNCDGQFGRRVVAIEAPVDFERFEGDARPCGLTDTIGSELSRVLAEHYGQFSDRAQIQDWLRIECPKEFALLAAVGGVDRALPVTGRWLEPSVLRHEGTAAFRGCGWDEKGADAIAATLERALMSFYKSKEVKRC